MSTPKTVNLSTPLEQLKGVGEITIRGLHKLNLITVYDLLNHFPRRWEDYSEVATIARLRPGNITIHAQVESIQLKSAIRRKLTITEAVLADNTGTTKAVWFNQPYVSNALIKGKSYYFAGEFAFKSNNLALQNPTYAEGLQAGRAGKIVPIYSENKFINSKLLQKLISQVIDTADRIEQILPNSVVSENKLLQKSVAIRELHLPTTQTKLKLAQRTLAFEELFLLIVAGFAIRADIMAQPAKKVPFDSELAKAFVSKLPFELTDSQRKVAWQILQDMARSHPMNRLIQGDVGSGKTAVAFFAATMAAQAGYQTALMVPTEILARQHEAQAQKLLAPLGVKVATLVSSMKSIDKTNVYKRVSAGDARLVIGTHSLLNETLQFHSLNLVVIDEQHRFGVNQRNVLKQKAKHLPHLLTMTATPIPRTLALVVYSDLDISIIDELPPGRLPIHTKLYLEIERANAYAAIDEQIQAGRQVFIICPQIGENDTTGAKSVQTEFEKLQRTIFAHRNIASMHGRMSGAQKTKTMEDFAAHKFDILIATSVVEVGVDVPNATVMMIEDADRFGLAALHQLRGRVGRAKHQSYCYLFTQTTNETAIHRLEALERTNDGFRLARIDLETRGAGEVYGTAQHGKFDLRLARLDDTVLIACAREAAQSFMSKGVMLQYPAVKRAVESIAQVTRLD